MLTERRTVKPERGQQLGDWKISFPDDVIVLDQIKNGRSRDGAVLDQPCSKSKGKRKATNRPTKFFVEKGNEIAMNTRNRLNGFQISQRVKDEV